ncbi:MAG: hypothetical protein MH321_03090, partial [Leptospiraceae bacterium]|nr:hypothetical protein [Leptospiraceae bacterium]
TGYDLSFGNGQPPSANVTIQNGSTNAQVGTSGATVTSTVGGSNVAVGVTADGSVSGSASGSFGANTGYDLSFGNGQPPSANVTIQNGSTNAQVGTSGASVTSTVGSSNVAVGVTADGSVSGSVSGNLGDNTGYGVSFGSGQATTVNVTAGNGTDSVQVGTNGVSLNTNIDGNQVSVDSDGNTTINGSTPQEIIDSIDLMNPLTFGISQEEFTNLTAGLAIDEVNGFVDFLNEYPDDLAALGLVGMLGAYLFTIRRREEEERVEGENEEDEVENNEEEGSLDENDSKDEILEREATIDLTGDNESSESSKIDYEKERRALINSLPEEEKKRIFAEEQKKANNNIPVLVNQIKENTTTIFNDRFDAALKVVESLKLWSKNGKITNRKSIIENGYNIRLKQDKEIPRINGEISLLANDLSKREYRGNNLSKIREKEMKGFNLTTSSGLSKAYLHTYNELSNLGENYDSVLSKKELAKIGKNGNYADLYKMIPQNIKSSIEKKLIEEGLKPAFENMQDSEILKSAYERVVVTQYLESKKINQLKSNIKTKAEQIASIKESIRTNVTEYYDKSSIVIKENLTFVIPKLDENDKPIILKNGKAAVESIRYDDPNLTKKQKELISKAKEDKLASKITKEQSSAIKLLNASVLNIVDVKSLERAIEIEREILLRVPPEKIREISSREKDETKKNKEIQEYIEGLKKTHKDRLEILDSFDIENRVKEFVDPSKMSQGKNGAVYQQLITTYKIFKNIDINEAISKISDPNKKEIAIEAISFIQNTKSAEEFANGSQAALCNVISAWEAGRIAGRPESEVNPNFSEFYVEQVLAGNIKLDNYGKGINKVDGVFYNSYKPYLEPTERLGEKNDLYDKLDVTKVKTILESTDAQVAQVYLDYEGDQDGNHFIIAYKNANGVWTLKDHNLPNGSSKVGSDLVEALDKGKIKDIRLVKPRSN